MKRAWAFLACLLGWVSLIGCEHTPDQPAAARPAELGLAAFSEFLAFLKAYPQILGKLSSDAAVRFQALGATP